MNILNQINENECLKIKVKDLENDLAKEQNKAQYFKKAQKRIEELETKLGITEKALDLACETYWNDCGMEDCPADIIDNFIDTYEKCKTCPNGGDRFINDKGCCWVDYFKTKAKEMMKSE